ncbi:MAG: C1 family peptidase [Gemmatimonadaceae bacterium]
MAAKKKSALTLRDIRWYGRKPDTPDQRDYLFQIEHPRAVLRTASLPASVDLRDKFPKCYDQLQIGSCVGNACAGAFAYMLKNENLRTFKGSRLFVYYNARAIEGNIKSDSGCEIRDGVKVLAKLGIPPETKWPYKIAKFAAKPPASAYTAALTHEALTYSRVDANGDPLQLQQALAAGFPVIIGISVYASFETDAVASSGDVPVPEQSEQMLGGHALVAVGYYSDVPGKELTFIVRNSWGPAWGDEGYGHIPASYLTNPDLASDFWVLSAVT